MATDSQNTLRPSPYFAYDNPGPTGGLVRTTNRIALSLTDTLIVAAAKQSWTFYKYQNSLIAANIIGQRIKIPLYDRIGLYNLVLDDRNLRFVTLLSRILKQRPGTLIDVGVKEVVPEFRTRL